MKYGSISAKAMEGKVLAVSWRTPPTVGPAWVQKGTSSAHQPSFPCPNAQSWSEEQEIRNRCHSLRTLPSSQQPMDSHPLQPFFDLTAQFCCCSSPPKLLR